jgi:hypothetical protein
LSCSPEQAQLAANKKASGFRQGFFFIVGMTRFELAASSSRTKRATGLRYIPFIAKI